MVEVQNTYYDTEIQIICDDQPTATAIQAILRDDGFYSYIDPNITDKWVLNVPKYAIIDAFMKSYSPRYLDKKAEEKKVI
jgi:hypothetical protein